MGRTHHCQASTQAFPGSSAGKESACNAGDPGLISWGRENPLGKE